MNAQTASLCSSSSAPAALIDSPMETFGEILKRMRESRALTQTQLADRAEVSEGLIRRAESLEHGPAAGQLSIKRSTAALLLKGLESKTPLTPTERETYLRATGLTQLANLGRQMADSILNPGKDVERAHELVDTLINRVGAAEAISALQSALRLSGFAVEEEFVRVARPPVQRDGYVEQEFAHYRKPTSKPPAKAAPKRKRGTA